MDNLTTIEIWVLVIALAWLLILGIALALVFLPFSAAVPGLWLRAALPYGLLGLVAIAVACLVLWRYAFGTELRTNGTDRLVETRGPEDTLWLVSLFQGANYRAPAKRALQHLGPAASVALPQVQAVASGGDSFASADALAVIGSMGAAAAPAILTVVAAASNDDRGVRFAAVAALAQLKRLDALEPPVLSDILRDLAQQLASTTYSESNSARDALIALGPAAAPVLSEVEAAAKSTDATVSSNAPRVLEAIQGKPGPAPSDQPPSSALSVAPGATKSAAITVQSIKSLRRTALHGGPIETRKRAIAALADLGPRRVVVRTLIAAMRDSDAAARAASMDALGRLGPAAESALPYLVTAARDRVGGVGAWLLGALQALVIWPALVVFALQQIIVNRPQAELLQWIGFLPSGVQPAIETGVTWLRAHADFLTFLAAVAIYFTLVLLTMMARYLYNKRRHVVRDSAIRALPAFLASIEDANA